MFDPAKISAKTKRQPSTEPSAAGEKDFSDALEKLSASTNFSGVLPSPIAPNTQVTSAAQTAKEIAQLEPQGKINIVSILQKQAPAPGTSQMLFERTERLENLQRRELELEPGYCSLVELEPGYCSLQSDATG